MIRDKDAPVAVNLESVRITGITREDLPSAVRAYLEEASVTDIDAVQIAIAVERRSLQKRMQRRPTARIAPRCGRISDPQLVR
jgi:hypothetical protein